MKVPQVPAPAANEIAQQAESGRWFILMGHPGFNSAANNWNGYASKAGAIAASLRYAAKGAKHRAQLADPLEVPDASAEVDASPCGACGAVADCGCDE